MRRLALAALLASQVAASSHAQDGVIDLANLENYANQGKPAYIQQDNTPAGNQITNAGATLGRILFYDKRLSRNNTVSCSSCHQQAHAFGDSAVASLGVAGTTGRHSTRLPNARFGTEVHFFWDERAATLEDQATQPIRNAIEMGFSGTGVDPAFSDLLARLDAIPEYPILFNFVFGTPTIDEPRIQNAIAQFVRSIQSFDSKYDAGRALRPDPQPFPNFTASENNGKQLFLGPPAQGGAGCAGCHRPPEFDIDPNSRNNAVIFSIGGGTDLTNTRSPSLRNLANANGQLNGPFMHNGNFTTLAQVINHYDVIPADNPNLDPRLRRPGGQVQRLNLTPQEKLDLEAFLLTLGGTAVYTEQKWSNPFSAAGTITLINVPPGSTPTPAPTPAPSPTSTPNTPPTPTPTPAPSSTPNPTSTPTPGPSSTPNTSPTPTPGVTPAPTPTPAHPLNISTRLGVGTGDNAMIGGFIITGTNPKQVLIRSLGPSLSNLGLTGLLNDPVLELRAENGALLFQNDNWKDAQRTEIEGTPFQPSDDREAVIIATLAPAAYTAVLTGKNQTTGVGLLEIYDLNQAVDSQLANISTRGFVGAQNNVMIGGFILGGNPPQVGDTRVAIRGLGPSLSQFGLGNLLTDPTLELHDANGATLITNDNWTDDPAAAALLTTNGLAPTNPNESAIFTSLPAGQFTAILAGKNGGTGIGIIEVYNLR